MGPSPTATPQKPRLKEKQYHYSHRAGDSARGEYKFSEDELVYTLKAYKWDEVEDEWKEMESSMFGNN